MVSELKQCVCCPVAWRVALSCWVWSSASAILGAVALVGISLGTPGAARWAGGTALAVCSGAGRAGQSAQRPAGRAEVSAWTASLVGFFCCGFMPPPSHNVF